MFCLLHQRVERQVPDLMLSISRSLEIRIIFKMCKLINNAIVLLPCWLLFAATRITGQLKEKYVGCFADNERIHKLEPVLKDADNLTIEICIQKCYNDTNGIQSEMTFAALNNGRDCSCRSSAGEQLLDRNCNRKCTGAPVQICGGNQNEKFYSLYTVCSVGYFGTECDQPCHCKSHSPCGRKSGICQNGCEEQWTGSSCNISDIQKQYIGCYGDGLPNNAMDVKNIGGKTGHNTNNTNSNEFCIEICSANYYTYAGMQYSYDCDCGEKYNRYGNEIYTGQLANCNYACTANRSQKCGGYFALSVYYVCPVGFYGRDCINQCHCSDGGPCRFNGSCLTSTRRACKPGWTGSACNIRVCPVGFYGRDCINRCHCSDGGPCRFNGSCLTSTSISCKPGWIGSACNVRDCSINNGDCEYNEKCETVDLGFAHVPMCRCEDGSYRDKNNNSCSSTHLRHVGCYKGSTTQYTSVELPTNNTLTIELCILKCRQLNKKYSIIQGGATCRCGDEYARNSPAPDAECQVPCVGNKQQYCGGMDPVYVIYTAKSFLRHYIGCYKDTSSRAMEKGFQWLTSNNNTIDSCIRLCASLGYSYAGLQFSFECFCGNSYEKYGSLPESRCNMNCSGNRNQICGGSYANSVYGVNDILGCSTDRDCKRNESCKAIDLLNTTVSRCRCEKGFHEMPTEDFCKDVDECESGELLCNPTYENCVNMIGSYRCECKAGFINMSGQCEDIDECKSNTSSCNPTSENCVNNIGSYRCECKNGFRNMSGQCEDIDECQVESPASPCNAFAEYCLNSIGSYICMCKEDFTCGKCDDKHVRTKDQQTIDQENRSSSTTGILLGTFLAISLLINAVLAYLMNCARSRRADSGRGVVMSDIQRKYWKVSAHHENYYDDTSRLLGEDDVYEEIRMKRQVVY